jgi:hypothetical protein
MSPIRLQRPLQSPARPRADSLAATLTSWLAATPTAGDELSLPRSGSKGAAPGKRGSGFKLAAGDTHDALGSSLLLDDAAAPEDEEDDAFQELSRKMFGVVGDDALLGAGEEGAGGEGDDLTTALAGWLGGRLHADPLNPALEACSKADLAAADAVLLGGPAPAQIDALLGLGGGGDSDDDMMHIDAFLHGRAPLACRGMTQQRDGGSPEL